MPSLNAVGSTSAGVSSVLGPVYTLPSRSATKPATSATLGIRSTTSRAYSDVGVDRADLQQAVFEQLADAQALRAGEGEVELARDAQFEQVEMLRAADAGHDHVQVVQLAGIDPRQRTGEESACFWLLPSSTTRSPGAISASSAATRRSRGSTARQPGRARLRAPLLFLAAPRPLRRGEIGVVMSAPGFTLS